VSDLPALSRALESRTDQFSALLGSPEAVARFKTVALHAVSSRPDLLSCNPLSIIEAIRESATLGLEPTGINGEAYLVPYKGQVKLRIGWQGHLKLIRNSGLLRAVGAQVVYENDDFGIAYEGDPPFWHHPLLRGDRGSYRGAYAWARYPDGTWDFEWLPMEDIAPIRKIAAADSLMWNTFPGEGMRKSAIRRLAKRLPKSAHVARALAIEEELENDIRPVAQPALPARTAAMAALAARFPDASEEGEAQPAQEPATADPETGEVKEEQPPLPVPPTEGEAQSSNEAQSAQSVPDGTRSASELFADEELERLSRPVEES